MHEFGWFLKSHPCYFRPHPDYYDTEAISWLWNGFPSSSVVLALPVLYLDCDPKPI